MLDNLFYILALLLLGMLTKKSKVLPDNAADSLNLFVIYIALPAIVLLYLPRLKDISSLVFPMGIHWGSLILHFLLLNFVLKKLNVKDQLRYTCLIVSTLGNTAFLGIPMIKALMGEAALPVAIVYDQLGSGISFLLFATILIPIFKGEGVKDKQLIFKKLFSFPPFWAVVISLALRGAVFPASLMKVITPLAGTVIPLAIFSTGLNFKFKPTNEVLLPLSLGLISKLLFIPLLLVFLFMPTQWFSLPAFKVSVLQSGMPPMVSAGVIASVAGFDRELASALVAWGLIFSFMTIPFLNLLF